MISVVNIAALRLRRHDAHLIRILKVRENVLAVPFHFIGSLFILLKNRHHIVEGQLPRQRLHGNAVLHPPGIRVLPVFLIILRDLYRDIRSFDPAVNIPVAVHKGLLVRLRLGVLRQIRVHFLIAFFI